MTAILVVMTIAIFLAIDYVRSRKRVAQAEILGAAAAKRLPSEYIGGFQLPANVQYHPGHTWAMRESPTLVRVGIDDFGARLIGHIDAIQLPKLGQWIRQGQKVFTVRKDGRKAELVSPIEGEVTAVNQALTKDASLLATDPYGDGWLLAVMSPDAQTNFRNLFGGTLARQWMAETVSRLRAKLPALAGAVAQDGGLAVHDLGAHLPEQDWTELTREFFLS
jgi:glycine cleavage system H protein